MALGKVVSRPALAAVVSVPTLWPLTAGYAGSQEKVVGVLAGQQYTVEERAVNFQLVVEGTPPADATFFAQGPLVGLPVRLAGPDGGGTYTGATTVQVTVNPDGSIQPAPIAIFGGMGTNPAGTGPGNKLPGYSSLVVKDFGPTVIEDGQTFRAGVYFAATSNSDNVPTEQGAGEEVTDTPAGTATLEQAAADEPARGEAEREHSQAEDGFLGEVFESGRDFIKTVVNAFESFFSFLGGLFG